MQGRNVLRINMATVKEALEEYLGDMLENEGMRIDTVEEIEEDNNNWFQLILLPSDEK